MDKLFIKELEVKNKKILVRVDYNVPLDEQGNITDDSRIRATLPTVNYLLDEDIAEAGQGPGKFRVVLFLTPVET